LLFSCFRRNLCEDYGRERGRRETAGRKRKNNPKEEEEVKQQKKEEERTSERKEKKGKRERKRIIDNIVSDRRLPLVSLVFFLSFLQLGNVFDQFSNEFHLFSFVVGVVSVSVTKTKRKKKKEEKRERIREH
jgi:hypothetical protein